MAFNYSSKPGSQFQQQNAAMFGKPPLPGRSPNQANDGAMQGYMGPQGSMGPAASFRAEFQQEFNQPVGLQ